MWAPQIEDLGCLDLVLDEVIVESYVSRFVIMTSGRNIICTQRSVTPTALKEDLDEVD